MALVRPRLTDCYGLPLAQANADFAIPFLDEDIPLYLDPFLLYKSIAQADNALHTQVLQSFNRLGHDFTSGDEDGAVTRLVKLSECAEVGLGHSGKRLGRPIGVDAARELLTLFSRIPELESKGFLHLEEAQLLVAQVGPDRVSDIAANLLKSFLIDYTMAESEEIGLPVEDVRVDGVPSRDGSGFTDGVRAKLPVNPETKLPILLVPKRWLRSAPWISLDACRQYYQSMVFDDGTLTPPGERAKLLRYNRDNFGMLRQFVVARERASVSCTVDPLFKQIPVTSARKKWAEVKALNTGTGDKADRRYEDLLTHLLASMLYPQLDFAQAQVRTDSGAQIRDLVFYNTCGSPFLQDVREKYGSAQLVFEMKNVREIGREHVNQINRYLANEFGRFGVVVTRNVAPARIRKNIIDLWSGQRRCILVLSDVDIEFMVECFDGRQRDPIDVLVRSYAEFHRRCPS